MSKSSNGGTSLSGGSVGHWTGGGTWEVGWVSGGGSKNGSGHKSSASWDCDSKTIWDYEYEEREQIERKILCHEIGLAKAKELVRELEKKYSFVCDLDVEDLFEYASHKDPR